MPSRNRHQPRAGGPERLRLRARSRPSRPIRTSRPNGRSRHSAGSDRRGQNDTHSRMARMDCRTISLARSVGAPAGVGRGRGAGQPAGRLHRPHDARATACCAGRNRSSPQPTCEISTSGPRAFPRTSAPQPVRCGIAVSIVARWRCSTAECSPGSPTFIAFPFAIRVPKATALRWRRAISLREDASTPRASYCVWQRFVYGGQHTGRRPCTACAMTSDPRSMARVTARFRGVGGRGMTRGRERSRCSSPYRWWRSSPGWRATRTGRTPRCRCLRKARRSPIRSMPCSDLRRRSAPAAHGIVLFTAPPADSVIVLSAWHWNLSAGRREALERWVESGGRLVVDRTLVGGEARVRAVVGHCP